MKILISADMEGITGVTHWEQVTPGTPEYPHYCKLMTAEINSAVRGAIAGGANSVMVTDGHHHGRNILIEKLDPRAVLNSGSPLKASMVHGLANDVSGVIFIGYHAKMGTENAILDHTWSEDRISGVWINGREVGEAGLNGALCGHFDVPVIMATGDQALCLEVRGLFGNDIETVQVKTAVSRMAAECLTAKVAFELIEAAARRATQNLERKKGAKPFRVTTPIELIIEYLQTDMADKAALMPGSKRIGGRRVEYHGGDMPEIYQAFRTLATMAV